MKHQLLQRASALRDDKQAQGLPSGGERLFDRAPPGNQLFCGSQDVGRRQRDLRTPPAVRRVPSGGPRRRPRTSLGAAGEGAIERSPVRRSPVSRSTVGRASIRRCPASRLRRVPIGDPRLRRATGNGRWSRSILAGPAAARSVDGSGRPVLRAMAVGAIAARPIARRTPRASSRRRPVSNLASGSFRNGTIRRRIRSVRSGRPDAAAPGTARLRAARPLSPGRLAARPRSLSSAAWALPARGSRVRPAAVVRPAPISHERPRRYAASAVRRGCLRR